MRQNEWVEETTQLLRKWERICVKRKRAHYKTSNSYGWRNKLLSIPIILISTVLGSLSFIHPSFLEQTTVESSARLLTSRGLQSLEPTASPTLYPTNQCFWENYNTTDVITEAPFCDNSIIEYQNTFYKSTIMEVDELVCDRDVNYVGETAYNQFPVVDGITTQTEAEAWCIEHDEGYGIFYQQWNNGPIMCMVLAETPNEIKGGTKNFFGGVCISSGVLNNPTQTYINNCGNQLAIDIYNGNCALIENCAAACPGIVGGYDLQEMGFQDCECCYDFWEGCSWGECSTLVNANSSEDENDDGDGDGDGDGAGDGDGDGDGASSPTSIPTYTPTFAPTKTPTYAPTPRPIVSTPIPTSYPTSMPSNTSTGPQEKGMSSLFTYIIGAFNMLIAILSALHTFLKYDALEDRHHQYSRHFGTLQVDIETLLAQPQSQRGDATTLIENYKTKYAVLITNAPDLPEKLEIICYNEEREPSTIELT